MTEINTSGAVLVIGDTDTADRADMLAEKAAAKGVQIVQTFAFDPGAAQDQPAHRWRHRAREKRLVVLAGRAPDPRTAADRAPEFPR